MEAFEATFARIDRYGYSSYELERKAVSFAQAVG
jgi:hypothetical protein